MAGVRPSALPCTRLRDSCVACAVAKLRCSKQRPTCSRCDARGIDCQYFFARRPGRRREHGHGHPASCTSRNSRSAGQHSDPSQADRGTHTGPPETAGAGSGSGASIRPVDLMAESGPTTSAPGNHGWTAAMPDRTYLADAFSVPGESSMVPQLDDTEMGLLVRGSLDHPLPDPDGSLHTPNATNTVPAGAELTLNPPDAPSNDSIPADPPSIQDPPDPNPSTQAPTSSSPPTAPATSTPTVHAATIPTQPTCICVPRALALLRTLSCPQSPSSSSLPESHPALYTLYQHKPNIALARRMLSCPPCTGNTFLLAILSLIVLNILERYATALQRQLRDGNNSDNTNNNNNGSSQANASGTANANTNPSPSPNGSCIDPGTVGKLAHCIITCRRVPSRVIVSELCRLQSLVNHLAPRSVGTEALERMEGGMRQGLGGLSGEIIERLGRY